MRTDPKMLRRLRKPRQVVTIAGADVRRRLGVPQVLASECPAPRSERP